MTDLRDDPIVADTTASDAATARRLTRIDPPGALGRLEELAVRYAAVRGHHACPPPPELALAVFAADHGLATTNVSAHPRGHGSAIVASILEGSRAVSVLARSHGVALSVVDVGLAVTLDETPPAGGARFFSAKVGRGTANALLAPAMTSEQRDHAIRVGFEEAVRLSAEGKTIVGVGDVGIGNTTSAAALVCGLTGASSRDVVGRGSGIDDETLERKRHVVDVALDVHRSASSDALALLSAVGGFEIAAMVGFILGAASARMLVVLDGFPCTAAALVAAASMPSAVDSLVASHRAAETGAGFVLERLGLSPLLDLGLCVGEGTGALLGMSLVRDALALERETPTSTG